MSMNDRVTTTTQGPHSGPLTRTQFALTRSPPPFPISCFMMLSIQFPSGNLDAPDQVIFRELDFLDALDSNLLSAL